MSKKKDVQRGRRPSCTRKMKVMIKELNGSAALEAVARSIEPELREAFRQHDEILRLSQEVLRNHPRVMRRSV